MIITFNILCFTIDKCGRLRPQYEKNNIRQPHDMPCCAVLLLFGSPSIAISEYDNKKISKKTKKFSPTRICCLNLVSSEPLSLYTQLSVSHPKGNFGEWSDSPQSLKRTISNISSVEIVILIFLVFRLFATSQSLASHWRFCDLSFSKQSLKRSNSAETGVV